MSLYLLWLFGGFFLVDGAFYSILRVGGTTTLGTMFYRGVLRRFVILVYVSAGVTPLFGAPIRTNV